MVSSKGAKDGHEVVIDNGNKDVLICCTTAWGRECWALAACRSMVESPEALRVLEWEQGKKGAPKVPPEPLIPGT